MKSVMTDKFDLETLKNFSVKSYYIIYESMKSWSSIDKEPVRRKSTKFF